MQKMSEMSINYSCATIFNGGGIGNTSFNAVLGIYRKHWLKNLYVSSFVPSEVDASLIKTLGLPGKTLRKLTRFNPSLFYRLHDDYFDSFVARNLKPAQIFHGWNQHCLKSLQVARSQGSRIVIERASSHLLTAQAILKEEYDKFGLAVPPIDKKALEKGLAEFELADKITVPSKFAYESFLKQKVPVEKLVQIPFGVELVKFSPRPKKGDIFTYLFVGQVSLRKGAHYLLDAWKRMKDSKSRLLIAGKVMPDMKPYLDKESLPERVEITYFNHPQEAYEQADVFVFPSLEEGMALVTLEALASGLPIITTFNSGSVVEDGIEGFIVPSANSHFLALKMLQLHEDARLREQFATNARKKAENYSWDAYREKLLTFYQTLV